MRSIEWHWWCPVHGTISLIEDWGPFTVDPLIYKGHHCNTDGCSEELLHEYLL